MRQKSITDGFLVKFGSIYLAKIAVAVLKKSVRLKTKKVPPTRISLAHLNDAETSIIRAVQIEET